jgi:hypothetical protein
VCEVLAPRQATRGGPIILCQIENQIFFPRGGKSQYAFGADTLDLAYDGGLVMGKYVDWLQRRFGSIKRLNATYHSNYRDFTRVSPPEYRVGWTFTCNPAFPATSHCQRRGTTVSFAAG